jgi:hypothetical protein
MLRFFHGASLGNGSKSGCAAFSLLHRERITCGVLWNMEYEVFHTRYICTYVLRSKFIIGALATAFPFLLLSGLSLPVHHNIIGLKLLDGMAKSSEYMDKRKGFAYETGLYSIHILRFYLRTYVYISDRYHRRINRPLFMRPYNYESHL